MCTCKIRRWSRSTYIYYYVNHHVDYKYNLLIILYYIDHGYVLLTKNLFLSRFSGFLRIIFVGSSSAHDDYSCDQANKCWDTISLWSMKLSPFPILKEYSSHALDMETVLGGYPFDYDFISSRELEHCANVI